jgi:hypothetical protein
VIQHVKKTTETRDGKVFTVTRLRSVAPDPNRDQTSHKGFWHSSDLKKRKKMK